MLHRITVWSPGQRCNPMDERYRIDNMKHRVFTLAAILLVAVQAAFAQERSIVVASTTSTEQSGLFGFLLARFSAKAGIQVKVVAVRTGRTLGSTGSNCFS